MTKDVYISGVSSYLPSRRVSVEEASNAGRYDLKRATTDKFRSISVEVNRPAHAMALEAARPLLEVGSGDIRNLYLTSIHRHGHQHLWPPASYLQHELGLDTTARVMSLSHGCNSGFIACSIAHDMLSAGIRGDHLIVGADRYEDSNFDRWQSDLGTLYGDAAAAIRLSDEPGLFRVQHIGLESEARLERMYRGETIHVEGPEDHSIGRAKRDFLDRNGKDHFLQLFSAATQRLRTDLLQNTDLLNQPAEHVIYPNVGAGLSAALYEEAFGDLGLNNGWEFGRTIGHTGTADQFLGLDKLVKQNVLIPGDRALLIGAGNGLSLAGLLVEMTGHISLPELGFHTARRTSSG